MLVTAVAALATLVPATAQATDTTIPVLGHVWVGIGPDAIAVEPVSNMIYAVNQSTVAVVSGKTDKLVTKFTVPGAYLYQVAVDPQTDRIYATDFGAHNVVVISGKTNTVIATIPLSSSSDDIAVDPSTDMIYASVNQAVVAIKGRTDKVVATIPGAGGAVTVNPATGTVYASEPQAVAVISEQTNTVVKTIPLAISADDIRSLAINPITSNLYVLLAGSLASRPRAVMVVDSQTGAVTATIGLPGKPQQIAVDPTVNAAFVANSWDFRVSKISGTGNKVVARTALPGTTYGFAVDPKNNKLYVGVIRTHSLLILRA